MKTGIFIILLIFLWQPSSFSQEFGCHWVSFPLPNDSSEVIFKQTYTYKQKPLLASITLASTGNVKVYVNERNISRDILIKGMDNGSLIYRTFNITRYLKPNKNTISVWYAPTQNSLVGKQLSLEYYGIDADGENFYHKADGKWLCKELHGCSTPSDKEYYDATRIPHNWKTFDASQSKTWQHPTGCPTRNDSNIGARISFKQNLLNKILRPVATYTDSVGFHIDFGRPFYGTIRLTIRDAKRGAQMNISGLNYVCTGEMDEQAFRRFNFQKQRVFKILGEEFKKNWIVFIEGLEIEP